jgi:defect-in-organelle-trafficking protein DotC
MIGLINKRDIYNSARAFACFGVFMPAVFMFVVFMFVLVIAPISASASETAGERPPERSTLENIEKLNKIVNEETGMPFDIRLEASREAALSYGARGGLAWRTFEIRSELHGRDSYLDKVFDFRQLLIPAPSGLLIEPPIISESINSMIIATGGREAAVADRIYNISENARIVSAPRNWRNYLEREWGDVTPPPDLLRPSSAEEREQWVKWVREGWKMGVEQANEIFEQDLGELKAHFHGMVRYRTLLAQGMVSQPFALMVDRGVTGGGVQMLIGDRAVEITGMPGLIPGTEQWQPANR